MRDNEFTEKDLVLIADAIDANESLVNVDLWDNYACNIETFAKINAALIDNIKHLQVNGAYIAKEWVNVKLFTKAGIWPKKIWRMSCYESMSAYKGIHMYNQQDMPLYNERNMQHDLNMYSDINLYDQTNAYSDMNTPTGVRS